MTRAYYQRDINRFISDNNDEIIGILVKHYEFNLEEQQRNAWIEQIRILKNNFNDLKGHVIFEYSIPRMGKRIDCVVITGAVIFAIEFKVGAERYDSYAIDQVMDYALDLKNFHEQSHNKIIAPVLVASKAPDLSCEIEFYEDNIIHPLKCNAFSLKNIFEIVNRDIKGEEIDPMAWIDSIYKPTPTIIEAAQALYNGHSVHEISRSDSGAINLSRTSDAICNIIKESKANSWKSICFLTGVPGAGKTLAGLNLATSWQNIDESAHAVFLSGNGPLVEVLREALSRDKVKMKKEEGEKLKKGDAAREVKAFIQNIHNFRDDALSNEKPPINKVVIFDEAQRAWTQRKTAAFMKEKKGIQEFSMSEPEFLISVMNRHIEWATIICLIGGGQEIHTGEAGLQEWFNSLKRSFRSWHIYISTKLKDHEYTRGMDLYNANDFDSIIDNDDLHLSVSVRSFRSEKVSALVKSILDNDINSAAQLYKGVKTSYPFVITRDIKKAKQWLLNKARGNEQFGLIASSGGLRLKPFGINVKAEIDPRNWFLNGKDDVRSSYFLEDVATEFDIQGLELDWTCVAWDADLRYRQEGWQCKSFRGTSWQEVKDPDSRIYLLNTYRVLLTRARQGMVVFIPSGSESDQTRKSEYYNGTYEYLKSIGIEEI